MVEQRINRRFRGLAEPDAPLPTPEPAPAPPADAAGTIRLRGPIRRADVPRVTRAALAALADCPPGIVDCEAAEIDPPALPTIDVLARIALAASRTRHDLRLEHASPELVELLALCGLTGTIRRTATGSAAIHAGDDSGGEPGR
jgi:hypothetical protein